MIHLRVVSPPDRTDEVLKLLTDDPATCNIVRMSDASHRPDGDVVTADVAREDASVIVSDLRHLGIDYASSHPKAAAYVEAVLARPSFARLIEGETAFLAQRAA